MLNTVASTMSSMEKELNKDFKCKAFSDLCL